MAAENFVGTADTSSVTRSRAPTKKNTNLSQCKALVSANYSMADLTRAQNLRHLCPEFYPQGEPFIFILSGYIIWLLLRIVHVKFYPRTCGVTHVTKAGSQF